MRLREFLNLYDNWDGVVCVNDNNSNLIVKGEVAVALSYREIYLKEVVSFGIHNNELCVRVK